MCSQSLARGADASCSLRTEDSSGCAVSLGYGDDPCCQLQPATYDIPTEDSSVCAVGLGGDDSPRQSLARGAGRD